MLEGFTEERSLKSDSLAVEHRVGALDASRVSFADALESAHAAQDFLSDSVRNELLQIRDLLAEAG